MSLTLYAHPFSSYCQKVLVALYENDVPFEYRTLEDPSAMAELKARWPFARFPILVDDGNTIAESTIIIEHLMLRHGGRVRWLPDDPIEALEVRFLDRFFDNDAMTAMQKPVFEAIRKDNARRDEAMAEARRVLDLAYRWLEQRLEGRTWAAGETLSLADCAAAPSLFYADWVHPIAPVFPQLRAYRSRLLAWPAFARAVDEADRFGSTFRWVRQTGTEANRRGCLAREPTATQTTPSRHGAIQHPRRNEQQERSECRGQLPPIE